MIHLTVHHDFTSNCRKNFLTEWTLVDDERLLNFGERDHGLHSFKHTLRLCFHVLQQATSLNEFILFWQQKLLKHVKCGTNDEMRILSLNFYRGRPPRIGSSISNSFPVHCSRSHRFQRQLSAIPGEFNLRVIITRMNRDYASSCRKKIFFATLEGGKNVALEGKMLWKLVSGFLRYKSESFYEQSEPLSDL